MRLFKLLRAEDVSGISGTGHVADGVVFQDGTAVMRWLTLTPSTSMYANIEHLEHIHSHGGRTKIEWLSDTIE